MFLTNHYFQPVKQGSAISNGRELNSCLGQDFNYKLDSFGSYYYNIMSTFMQPIIELKTQLRLRPVNWNLSMVKHVLVWPGPWTNFN